MRLESGHVNLFRLYEYVARHPRYPWGGMRDYKKIVNNLVENIPQKPGWYLWGKFNNVGWWETIYLGKAGKKKTSSLHARIQEEVSDERGAFWATVFGIEPIERQFRLASKGLEGTRMYRKCNTHFILWISTNAMTEHEVVTEEAILMGLYRPASNRQRPSIHEVSKHTKEIVDKVDFEIKKIKTQI